MLFFFFFKVKPVTSEVKHATFGLATSLMLIFFPEAREGVLARPVEPLENDEVR